MKKFIFVSDFDGTMTQRDFYKILLDKYRAVIAGDPYGVWLNKEISDLEFLIRLFAGLDRDETQIQADMDSMKLDPYAPDFVRRVREAGGEFAIVSLGLDYYIDYVLDKAGIEAELFSNRGRYAERSIQVTGALGSHYNSEWFGVDKEAVIQRLKQDYETVYFAGDGRIDIKAAQAADRVFAKAALQQHLTEAGTPFMAFNNFKDIAAVLSQEGLL